MADLRKQDRHRSARLHRPVDPRTVGSRARGPKRHHRRRPCGFRDR
ncbi:hypothetical protein ACFFX0_25340 [Citricoccus parietis]|uniref:Uncharacterized protein n=1 Tax=Citricoccus parietis TaxID=592307 RepID=A0ABV5G5W7_9MICC